jgi:hypothetical protein
MHSAIFFRSETLPITHTSSEYTRTWIVDCEHLQTVKYRDATKIAQEKTNA